MIFSCSPFPTLGGELGAGEKGVFQCRPKVSEVVDEQGQTPERRLHHLRSYFLQMVGDVCISFKGAEGLAAVEELNGANDREAITPVHLAEALQYRLKLELM